MALLIELYVLIGIFAATFLGGAGVLQKRGLDELPDLDADWWIKGGKLQWDMIKEVISKVLNVYFLSGAAVGLLGGLLYIVAISKGEITIVQPLMALGNFWAVFLGVLWLKESLTKIEYFGVGLIIAGIILLNMAA